VQAIAVQEEALLVQHGAEVIAYAFVQVHPHREPESRGKIDAHRALGGRPHLVHLPHGRGL
jgi:hypothetical protein